MRNHRALNEPRTENQPIDARIIFIDHMWVLDDYLSSEEKNLIESYGGVYLYDANSVTYIASTQPSYEMYFLYPRVYLTKEGEELDENGTFRERLEQEFASSESPVDYMDAHDIDRMAAKLSKDDYYVVGPTKIPFSTESEEEQMEALREDFTSNHVV